MNCIIRANFVAAGSGIPDVWYKYYKTGLEEENDSFISTTLCTLERISLSTQKQVHRIRSGGQMNETT